MPIQPKVPLAAAAGGLLLAGAAGWLPLWMGAAAAGAAVGTLAVRRPRDPQRDFVAAVSHDLRTPVAQIRLLSETLLLGRAADDAERARWLEAIAREAQVLDDRIASILLFAHDDGLAAALPPQRVDLTALVEDVVAGYAPVAAGRGMRLESDAAQGVAARGDPRTLRLALVNLLENACRYGPEGQTVTVTLREADGAACLTVADRGPGISAEESERVWQPFVRRDAGGAAAGSGLGLAVVRKVAAGHRGRAFVDPPAGVGARVSLCIPCIADPEGSGA